MMRRACYLFTICAKKGGAAPGGIGIELAFHVLRSGIALDPAR
jgi:hypothetical protein